MKSRTRTIQAIRSIPFMTARATGCGDEIRVAFRRSESIPETEASAYYTDDLSDALDTARLMSARHESATRIQD